MSSLASIRSKTLVAFALTVPCTIQTPTPPARLPSSATTLRRNVSPARIRLQTFIGSPHFRTGGIVRLANPVELPALEGSQSWSVRRGCGRCPQGQRQDHVGPAVDEQVDDDEQTNDPEARIGPSVPDEDTEEQIDNPGEQDPRPARELFHEREDDTEQAAHQEDCCEHQRDDFRRPDGVLKQEQADQQVEGGGEQVQGEAPPVAHHHGMDYFRDPFDQQEPPEDEYGGHRCNEGGADCEEADDEGHHTQGEEEPPGVTQTRELLGRWGGGGGCEWKAHGVSLLVLKVH